MQKEPAEAAGKELDAAFAAASGDIFKILREAESYAVERTTIARATGERFSGQLEAYRASKDIYKRQQKLAVLEESLEDTRKFIVAGDANDTQVFIIDMQEKLTPDLYDITGLEETDKK